MADKSPALIRLRKALETLQARDTAENHQHWQALIDEVDAGIGEYEDIVADLEGYVHLLESEKYHGIGEDWQDYFWGYEEDDDEEDDNARNN